MAFLKSLNFSFLNMASIAVFIVGTASNAFAAETGAATGGLGNLATPIESLGELTSVTENIQAGISTPLGELIDENDCQRKMVMPEEQPPLVAGDMKIPKFSIDISGPGCPVLLSAELSGTQTATGFTAQFKFKYVAQSAEAKALYDIDRAEFQGDLVAETVQSPNGGGLDFMFTYTGGGNSKSQGPFTSLNNMTGKFVVSVGAPRGEPRIGTALPFNFKIEGGFEDLLKFDFKNESAELKSSVKLSGFSPSAVYTVNGNVVPEAEYRKIRDLVKLPGAGDIGLGSDEPSTLECNVEVIRPNRALPIASSRSCGGSKKNEVEVDGVKMIFDFISDPSSTSIRVDVCPAGSSCQSVERAFLPDETASYTDEVFSTYSVVTTCEVVPVCTP